MAKRKAAKSKGRGRAAARKSPARKAARKTARKTARKAAPRRSSRPAAKRAKAPARKAAPRKAAPKKKNAAAGSKPAARKTAPKRVAPAKAPRNVVARKAPALNRLRRTVQDEDFVQGPPSSLDLDRNASAARTGRRKLSDSYREHTETSPALTGGDVDADWESAYSVGDEAPGGDNPTPDQDIVDEIGRAVGIEYEDNEELKGEKKVSDRDKHRWELDPASAEDYPDHDED